MCGRFASDLPPELVARLFDARNALLNIAPNWNTAPTQQAMVVRRHPETGERNLDALTWGLMPSWTKDRKAQRPINARAETVAKLPTFRQAFAKRRAIVPVTAFYEWRRREGEPKQPFAIGRADGLPLVSDCCLSSEFVRVSHLAARNSGKSSTPFPSMQQFREANRQRLQALTTGFELRPVTNLPATLQRTLSGI